MTAEPTPQTGASMHHRLRRRALPFAALAAALLAGCATNAPQDFMKPEGPNAQNIDDLQRFPFYAAGVVGVLVMVAVVYVVWRYRDRGQPIPSQHHSGNLVEFLSIGGSAVLLAAIAVPSFRGIWDLAETDDCKMSVNVSGQQWWWEYAYPQQEGIERPIVTSGQLVIPTGECVLLRITSRDVIHSFWIPKLNGKKDAVPGRVHMLRMEADNPGMYLGQCTEFCGLSHANMKMDLVALRPDDFASWVSMQRVSATEIADVASTPAGRGQEVFENNCARCHQVSGLTDAKGNPQIPAADQSLVSGAAPNLTHLMSRNTFAGATYSLLNEDCRDALMALPPEQFGAKYLAGVDDGCLNVVELKEWLRNAPEKKPMYPDANEDGLGRGMPAMTSLPEGQIDDLVEYLKTLK